MRADEKDFAAVRSALVDVLCVDAEAVTRTARIQDDLGADSLDMVEVAFEIEEALGIDFEFYELGYGATVADVLAVVKKARTER